MRYSCWYWRCCNNCYRGGCSLALASTQTPDENAAIEFKDDNLKKALLNILVLQGKIDRNAQQITYKQALTVEDLSPKSLGSYTLGDKKIKNLSGLEAFKNLKFLNIGYNTIESLTPLANLKNLEDLVIDGVNKDGSTPLDISPLSGLTALKKLSVCHNHIKDIQALAGMTKLEHLSLYDNDITDISPLKTCTALAEIYAAKNNIEDLSPLAELPQITGGNINDQKIEISASGDSVKLSDSNCMKFVKSWDNMTITAQDNARYDSDTQTATPAVGQSQATYTFNYTGGMRISGTITISFNTAKPIDIKDTTLKQALLSLLKKNSVIKLDATTITNVDAEKVTDLSGLADEISNLGKKVNDLSGLEAFSNLTKLSLKDNEISDLGPLGKLEKLAEVDLSHNKITDLKPLQHLENITKLDLSSNEITDLAPYADQLKKAKQESITLTSNHISSPISSDLSSVIKDATKQRFQITADGKVAQITGEIEGLNPDPAVDDISWTAAAKKQGALEPAVALLEKIPAKPDDVVLTLKKDKWSADYHINFQAYLNGLQKKVTDSTAGAAEKDRVSNLIKTPGTPLYSIEAAIAELGKSKTEGTDPDTDIENASDALLSLLQSAESVKATENYKKADSDKQTAYTNAIDAGQKVYDKLSSTSEQVKKAAEAIQTALNGLNGDAKKIQELNTALTTAKNTITDLNKKLTAAQQQAAADKAKIEELTKQLNTLKEQHTTLQNQFNALTQENEANKKKIEEKEKTITELTTKTADLQKEIDALKKQIEELKKQPQCPSGGSGSGGSSTGGSGLGGAAFGGAGLGLIGDLDNLSNSSSSAALYRLYNPWTGEHLFSVDYGEVEKLCPLGWTFEGIVASVDLASGKPVYRLYNPWTGDHHYTTDLAEVIRNEKIGWKNEGIAFYSKGKVGVVSLYNPFAKSFYHHYTTDPAEVERMVKDGWKEEGVKWYCSLPANNKK